MLTIRSAPDWAQRGGHDGRGTHNPDPQKLKAFTRAATQRFSDVHLWGVWNEPNYKAFLSPQYRNGKLVSPTMYRALLNAAASAIHAHPQNRVVAGETAPFSHWNRQGRPTAPGPLLFLRKLLCVDKSGHSTCKAKVHADIFATHPYTSGNAFHHAFNANDVSFGDLQQWKRVIKAASRAKHITNRSGGHGVGLWITEFSWDSKPIDPKSRIPDGFAAVRPGFRRAASAAGVKIDLLTATAGAGLVRVVKHEARAETVGTIIHLGTEQEQHGRRVDQDAHALVLDQLIEQARAAPYIP